jgi:hypothetical protein
MPIYPINSANFLLGSQLAFLHLLALRAGHPLEFERIKPAGISCCDDSQLRR